MVCSRSGLPKITGFPEAFAGTVASSNSVWYNCLKLFSGGGIMAIENGEWIMRGLDWDDPARIQRWEELIGWIDEIGFLPLFKNEVDGFSEEDNAACIF